MSSCAPAGAASARSCVRLPTSALRPCQTPATRAAIIERLIDVGYVDRDGRALVPTVKGMNVIRLLGDHPLTQPNLTGEWEQRLGAIEAGTETRKAFMKDIASFAGETVGMLDTTLKDVRIPRANLGPCPVCGHDIIEHRQARTDTGTHRQQALVRLVELLQRYAERGGQPGAQRIRAATGLQRRDGRIHRRDDVLGARSLHRESVAAGGCAADADLHAPEGDRAATLVGAARHEIAATVADLPGIRRRERYRVLVRDPLRTIDDTPGIEQATAGIGAGGGGDEPVSYTHLTLPTIYSV